MLRTLVVQRLDHGVMIVSFYIHLAFAQQGLQSIWAFCPVVDALLTIEAQIDIQSAVRLLCHKCAKFD